LIENFKISQDIKVKISRKRKKNNLKRRNYLKKKEKHTNSKKKRTVRKLPMNEENC